MTRRRCSGSGNDKSRTRGSEKKKKQKPVCNCLVVLPSNIFMLS